MWYNAPKLLPAGGLERGGTDYVFGVKDVVSNILHTEHIVSNSALQATSRQQLGHILPHAVKHSLVLLRMGKKLPETCWAHWNTTKLLLLHLVGLLHYLYQWCMVKQTSYFRILLYAAWQFCRSVSILSSQKHFALLLPFVTQMRCLV